MDPDLSTFNLPPIPSGEELEARKAEAEKLDLSRNWLDYTQSFPEPRYLLEYAGVPFAPLGGIQAITGHQKNGKTFLMAQFMAAVLAGGAEHMKAYMPTLRLHDKTAESLQRKPVVLYVDTEMEMLNTVKVVRRVQYLCNWPFDEQNAQLRVLWLRAEESNATRWAKTKQAIAEVQPTAIFLDGIRDVIGDFNSNEESANLISECMAMATRMECCMFCVLHENPGSEKMRGHLGTELANKVTDTFVSVKEKKDNAVTFTVSQKDARGKDVDDWKFEIVDDAGNIGIPRIITPAPTVKTDDIELIRKWLTEGQHDLPWPATATDVKYYIFNKRGGITNNDRQNVDLQAAKNRKFLKEQPKKEWEPEQKHPKLYLNENEILPF